MSASSAWFTFCAARSSMLAGVRRFCGHRIHRRRALSCRATRLQAGTPLTVQGDGAGERSAFL
jgi:hypothetical protein